MVTDVSYVAFVRERQMNVPIYLSKLEVIIGAEIN